MAIPAYMSITGVTQGPITAGASTADSVGNSVYQSGHEDEILVQGFRHEVALPRDPQSGQPASKSVHYPLVITKVLDRSSPLLQTALSSGEQLSEVVIRWYRISKEGQPQHYYTTTLKDAAIVKIKDYMHSCLEPANAHLPHLEDIHFSYRKITWTHEISPSSGIYDWRDAVGG